MDIVKGYRPLVISGCLVGAVVALLGLMPRSHAGVVPPSQASPPIVSLDQAQQQIPFKIDVPRIIPPGYQFRGARVFQIKTLDTPAQIAQFRSLRRPVTGFGILIMLPHEAGQPYQVRAAQGSPAEQQGLPSDHTETLVAVNGHNVLPHPGNTRPAFGDIRQMTPPVRLTLRNGSGAMRTVTLTRRGNYFLGGEMPLQPTGPRVALLYAASGSSLAVIESPEQSGVRFSYHGTTWSETVGGTSVTFYGPRWKPDASFERGHLHYDIANDTGPASQAQIEQLIGSL